MEIQVIQDTCSATQTGVDCNKAIAIRFGTRAYIIDTRPYQSRNTNFFAAVTQLGSDQIGFSYLPPTAQKSTYDFKFPDGSAMVISANPDTNYGIYMNYNAYFHASTNSMHGIWNTTALLSPALVTQGNMDNFFDSWVSPLLTPGHPSK